MALKPPFWLLSLPLFLVLYRNTATSPQGEDERDDCNGDLHLEDKRVNGDGDDRRIDADGGDKGVNGDGNGKDKNEDGEGKLFKIDNFKILSCP